MYARWGQDVNDCVCGREGCVYWCRFHEFPIDFVRGSSKEVRKRVQNESSYFAFLRADYRRDPFSTRAWYTFSGDGDCTFRIEDRVVSAFQEYVTYARGRSWDWVGDRFHRDISSLDRDGPVKEV